MSWRAKEGASNFEKNVEEKEVIQDMDEKKAVLDDMGPCTALLKKQCKKWYGRESRWGETSKEATIMV